MQRPALEIGALISKSRVVTPPRQAYRNKQKYKERCVKNKRKGVKNTFSCLNSSGSVAKY